MDSMADFISEQVQFSCLADQPYRGVEYFLQ